ncbi:MAG TPA: OsmC family protein, partial [Rhizobiales bacterium]|nr:OsmC family protein [Hyphomicrobiales bacterium]
RSQFVEDARAHELKTAIAHLKRALLVMHSPIDEVVGIDNATQIFVAAKHPKSFVSLDNADHLLSKKRDAIYAADVIAAWAGRYISGEEKDTSQPRHVHAPVHVEETGRSKYQQLAIAGNHELFADEPVSVGGADTGPSPYDFLSIALGACTSMTLRMYADHKGYDLGKVSVDISHAKVHAKDCADCGEGAKGRIDRFERTIKVEGDVPAEIRDRLIAIANKCPVHKTLLHSSVIATRLED